MGSPVEVLPKVMGRPLGSAPPTRVVFVEDDLFHFVHRDPVLGDVPEASPAPQPAK